MSSMREPQDFARRAEESPQLPAGDGEKVSGYGVMGLTFASGHVLGLRRWTGSCVGDGFTSIWHHDPDGRWTFYETSPCGVACHRYFGADVDRVSTGPIELDWEGGRRLRVRAEADGGIDWAIELGATAITRLLSRVGPALPTAAWRSPMVLSAMGRVASTALGVGTVKLTGLTSNGQHF